MRLCKDDLPVTTPNCTTTLPSDLMDSVVLPEFGGGAGVIKFTSEVLLHPLLGGDCGEIWMEVSLGVGLNCEVHCSLKNRVLII